MIAQNHYSLITNSFSVEKLTEYCSRIFQNSDEKLLLALLNSSMLQNDYL